MQVTRRGGLPPGLISHRRANLVWPILRINERQVIKLESAGQLDHVGEDTAPAWRKLEQTLIVDAALNTWSVEALDLGARSWMPQHWLTPTPMLHATWGLRLLDPISFEQARLIIVDAVLKHRWYGQGGETRDQFTRRMEMYTSIDDLLAEFSMYGHWVGPRRQPGLVSD